jgi:hypothetical protein
MLLQWAVAAVVVLQMLEVVVEVELLGAGLWQLLVALLVQVELALLVASHATAM